MKKLIHISIIILILVGLCLTEQLLTERYFKKTRSMIGEIELFLRNGQEISSEEVIQKTDELKKYWTEKESIICTFVNHTDIEDIGVEISKLKSAISEKNKEVFVESLNLISFYLDAYQHILGINLQSIF